LLSHVASKEGKPEDTSLHLRLALETSNGPYPLETLRAIDAQGLMNDLVSEYQKQLELATTGRFQQSNDTGISIVMSAKSKTLPGSQVRALKALADIARYQNRLPDEIRLRRQLTTVRDDAWDWFLLAEIFDQRQIEPASAREAYVRALELHNAHGGLTEAALQWARKRNAALTEPIYKPK
jgi:hypothetical protein